MVFPILSQAAIIALFSELQKETSYVVQRFYFLCQSNQKLISISQLGLENDEELAFYDAVAQNYENINGVEFLSDLIHEVVQTIKGNLKVDWTEPHRDDVKAGVRVAVRRILRRRNVKASDFKPFIDSFLEQAVALYKDWPVAA